MKVQPHNQFQHSLEIVSSLGKRYGLNVGGYTEATSGIENTTLIVTSATGKQVFRIYRHAKKTDAQIHAELDFMAYLQTNGVPVPSVIRNTSDEVVTTFQAASRPWQLIAMEFVAGEHPRSVSDALLADIAATQARMHLLAQNYNGQLGAVRKLTKLVEDEFIANIDLSSVEPRLRAFLERGAGYQLDLDADLPAGPCHIDFNKGNMLCQGDKVAAVLDFDDMAITSYIVCLAYTMWHLEGTYGSGTADKYLQFYEQHRPLTAQEKQYLPAAILFRHYMITAIRVLDGGTRPEDVDNYLQVEQLLRARVASGLEKI